MTPDPNHDPTRDQLAHLLTGNLRGLPALRLRRRIAHDPALAHEWNELQAVASQLRQTPLPVPRYPAPHWATPRALDLPESALRKRAFKRGVVASAALALPVVGTVAFSALNTAHATFQDRQGSTWTVESYFPGEIRLYDAKGVQVADYVSSPKLAFPHPANEVRTFFNGQPLETNDDVGVHALHTPSGQVVGYVELCLDHAWEREYDSTQDKEVLSLYDSGSLTPFATNRAFANQIYTLSLPSLYTAVDRRNGLACKVQGEASVRIRFPNALPHVSWMSGVASSTEPLPAKYLHNSPVLSETYQRALHSTKKPLLSWSMAAPTLDGKGGTYLMVDGHWLHPWRSGTFTGYGKHEIKNDRGEVTVVFDVQPVLHLNNMAGPPPQR